MNNFSTPLSPHRIIGPGPSGIVPNGVAGVEWNAVLRNKGAVAIGPLNLPRLGQGGPQLDVSPIDPRRTTDDLERGFLAAMGVAPASSARPSWA